MSANRRDGIPRPQPPPTARRPWRRRCAIAATVVTVIAATTAAHRFGLPTGDIANILLAVAALAGLLGYGRSARGRRST